MTAKEQNDYEKMYRGLKRILHYNTPDQLRRGSQKAYGLNYEEALGYSYENIQSEAKAALRGVRKPETGQQ